MNKKLITLTMFLFVLSSVLVDQFILDERFGDYYWIVVALAIGIEFSLLSLMKIRESGDLDSSTSVPIDKEYHNDHSQVPSGPKSEMGPRPIDLSGNVFEHNKSALEEDMRNLGIDPHRSDDDSENES
jgi:hypothetical protein